MEQVFLNPGMELLSVIWAIVFVMTGSLVMMVFPYLLMVVVVFPIWIGIALALVWNGFHRTPNRIRLNSDGLELSFRRREPRKIPWDEVTEVKVAPSDPTTFFGKNLSVAELNVKGERRPFAIHVLPAMAILESKKERRQNGPSTHSHSRG